MYKRQVQELSSDSFSRNYISRYVSVCLVDSITGEVFYNPLDHRIADFIELFKPEFEEEKLARIRKTALEQLTLKGFLPFDEFAKETGEPRQLLLKAFYDLQKEGRGKLRLLKDIGPVLEGET